MKYISICLIVFNLCFNQSLLDRLVVPIYLNSEFGYGYDDNYLKLSVPEQGSQLENRLGDSKQIDSKIIKTKFNILYMPYIFHNHDTKVNFSISSSKYLSSNLKSYNNYLVKISQHLAPYTWIKFGYSYTPSFYIKSYRQSDPHILFGIEDSYMPSMFASEKVSIELTAPIPLLHRTYFSSKYLFESQYFNPSFNEFDLEITSYYFKIRKRLLNKLSLSIAYMNSTADNISFMNGMFSTIDKDRSYIQNKLYMSFSIQKFYLLNRGISCGVYSSYEMREFSSSLVNDKLHFKREHSDLTINYWIKRHFNNNFDFKIKAVSRERVTLSPYYTEGTTVNNFKSFQKFEMWLSIILKMDINVY